MSWKLGFGSRAFAMQNGLRVFLGIAVILINAIVYSNFTDLYGILNYSITAVFYVGTNLKFSL